MKKKPKEKLFVVRKYVMATDVAAALKKEKSTPPDDIYVDDDWKKGAADRLAEAIGFGVEKLEE